MKTAAALLDIEKAFDKVWHDGLISKLIQNNTPHQLVHIIKSFLKDKSFYIKIGKAKSTTRSINVGVPQGSSLSPQLFCVYIDDMPRHRKAKTAPFVDDTLIHASNRTNNCSEKRFQAHLDFLIPWFKQ